MFPAPAGMNRPVTSLVGLRLRVPRASGDEPLIPSCDFAVIPVFPAPAGMNHVEIGIGDIPGRVPRASGDEPV